MDLGSFTELVFDHDLGRRLAIRLECQTNPPDDLPRRSRQPEAMDRVGFEVSFRRPSPAKEVKPFS